MKKLKKNNKLGLDVYSVRVVYLTIIVLISVISSIINPAIIYLSLGVTIIITLCILYLCVKELKNRKYRIEELSKSVDVVLKDSLNVINIPMAMIGDKSNIIWQNNVARHILPEEYIIDTGIKLEKKLKQNEGGYVTADIGNGEVYLAVANYIKFSNFNCMLVSYINKTEEGMLKKTLEDTKTAVGIIVVDNYDETMQGLEDMKKSEISSKIGTLIATWVNDNKGIVNSIDKDKYVIFIEKKYVEEMEKNQFEILEKVRNITNETKLPITISIGFSHNENTLDERYKASSSALDIALGRGGDQVVIKKDKKFDFYGGTNLGLEKTSRVRSRTIAQALREIMLKCEKVYIMGHKNSDIDCIGAAVGLYKMAKTLGKDASILMDSKYNSSTKTIIEKLKVLPDYDDVFMTQAEIKKIDTQNSILIIVDTHKKSYLAFSDVYEQFEKVVVIDHHRRGPEFIDNAILTYHEIYASSTSELVTEILMYMDGLELNPVEAESLYAGIVVDTKNFMFKTGVRTFEVAAFLKKFGIDVTQVKQLFQSDLETYIAKVEIVKNAEIIRGKIAISTSEEEYSDMPIIAAQAADELLSIAGVYASFVLCKVEKIIMISGRSMGDINVQSILEKIGGGGHLTFAGTQIAGVSIEEAKELLIKSIDEYYGNE